MNILVQQRIFVFGCKYEIETPSCIYSAKKKSFFFRDKIRLFAPHSRLLATIRGSFLFRPNYDIELAHGRTYHFRSEKSWKGVFSCKSTEESFRLYQHKRLKYSIFQNDSQIAAFTKNRVKLGRSDNYEIMMNDDANVVVITCMALVIDCGEREDETAGMVTIDLGSLGAEERPFDASWRPS